MSKRKEILTIALGLMAVLVILVGQLNYYQAQAKAIIDIEQQQNEDEDSNEELKVFTNDAVSNAQQFSFDQGLHFIADIIPETIEKQWIKDISVPKATKFFETLFQRIISPNAP